MPSISYPLALTAGILSFISPCVLPLVPVYLGYLSGGSISGVAAIPRRIVFKHALYFVGGFSAVFIVLFGLPATVLGSLLQDYSSWIAKIGGIIVILFGLHMWGVITVPWLNMTKQVELGSGMQPGFARSTLFGVTFAAGWTPCIGPLLGAVMTLAFTEPSRAVGYVAVYALGLAIPFLASALMLTRATNLLHRLNRYMRAVEYASGALMIAVGILLITGMFTLMNSYFIQMTPPWLLQYL